MYMIDLKPAYDALMDDLHNNDGKNVYNFENYKLDWNEDGNVYEVGFWRDRTLITH